MGIAIDGLLADGCQPVNERKVCRTRGGESCAFDGASIVLLPIADAAHVVHGPIVCCGNAWEGRGVRSTAGEFFRRGFTTDLDELDIVFGGADKLKATVRDVVRREHPEAVFVYETCVTGLIGEDIDAVCAELTEELGLSVIPVPCAGFVGPKNLGNRIAGSVLIDHVIGTAEPPDGSTGPCDVVLIGEYNVAGDLDLVEPLLAEAGITVLSRITGNARFEELRYAHRAKLSVTVCSRALINVARHLERHWKIPTVEVSFFGPSEIARSLRMIASELERISQDARGVSERVERVIARHEAELTGRLVPYVSALRGRRAVLYSGGVKSWSMVSCLADLGIRVSAVCVKKTSREDELKLLERAPGVRILEDMSPQTVRELMAGDHGEEGAILVAGGRNRYLAAKEGWPFVDVNQERESGYAGYDGFVALARDLAHTVRFYERHRRSVARPCKAVRPVRSTVRVVARSAAIDPIKTAPTLGALLALQGVHRALPVLHSAQGCTFLGKVLAIRHANEPIACRTTGLFTEAVVMASEEPVVQVAEKAARSARPDVLALVSGALAEVKGDDLDRAARELGDVAPAVVVVRAPDYVGSLEAGWSAAVQALVGIGGDRGSDRPSRSARPGAPARVAVLPGSYLTPGDVLELKEMLRCCGVEPIFVPDTSALDGSREGFSALTDGGVTLGELRALGGCERVLAIGASLAPVAEMLARRSGAEHAVLDPAIGLEATDTFLDMLRGIPGSRLGPRLERDRRVLIDAMRDAHGAFAGARIALALEPDHAMAVASLLDEMACPPVAAVVPVESDRAGLIPALDVIVGDLASVPEDIDLLISNGRGERTAAVRGASHIALGFPVPDRYGATRRVSIGYRGATALIDEIATVLTQRRKEQHR